MARKIIAALQVSLDGFIEGPNGEMDWVVGFIEEDEETWRDDFEMLAHVDTCVLGRVMYPAYEEYWTAALDPNRKLPLSGELPTAKHVEYAQWAYKTPHIVLSKTLDKVAWKTTRIVRDVEEIRRLKQQPGGKDIYAVGGATLVSSLMNQGLIDELRLVVHPLILGGGKALFKDVKDRQVLKLVQAKPFKSGKVSLTYIT
jgi:dihydrofolate reductase